MSLGKELLKKIRRRINDRIDDLPPRYRDWAKAHLLKKPRLKVVTSIEDDSCKEIVIQVIHEGEDSPYWLYYDVNEDKFGKVTILIDGILQKEWPYGEFNETIYSI